MYLASAILIMFYVLRRVYGVLASTLAIAVALTFCDPALLFQTTEARFHTLIIAEVALAILLYQRMMACPGQVPFRQHADKTGIHACIVMTHYFGPLYSGAILVGALLTGVILVRGGFARKRNLHPESLSSRPLSRSFFSRGLRVECCAAAGTSSISSLRLR